jgi:hypothetical protein
MRAATAPRAQCSRYIDMSTKKKLKIEKSSLKVPKLYFFLLKNLI